MSYTAPAGDAASFSVVLPHPLQVALTSGDLRLKRGFGTGYSPADGGSIATYFSTPITPPLGNACNFVDLNPPFRLLAGAATLAITASGVSETNRITAVGAATLAITATGELAPGIAVATGAAQILLTAAGALAVGASCSSAALIQIVALGSARFTPFVAAGPGRTTKLFTRTSAISARVMDKRVMVTARKGLPTNG